MGENNNRPLTLREFYLHQIGTLTEQTDRMEKQNDRMENFENGIRAQVTEALEIHAAFQLETSVQLTEDGVEIENLKTDVRSLKIYDRAASMAALALSTIATYFGWRGDR